MGGVKKESPTKDFEKRFNPPTVNGKNTGFNSLTQFKFKKENDITLCNNEKKRTH